MCIILALSIVNADSDVTLDKRAANTVLSRQKRHDREFLGQECIIETCSIETVQELINIRYRIGQYHSYRIAQRVHEVFREERDNIY